MQQIKFIGKHSVSNYMEAIYEAIKLCIWQNNHAVAGFKY